MRNKEDLVRTAKEVIFGDAVNLIAETNRDMFIQKLPRKVSSLNIVLLRC